MERRAHTTTVFGAVFDIAADRIIENVFWIYFAVNDIIHVWMPIVVLTRGFMTDAIRSFALSENKTPFEMMKRKWTRALTSCRYLSPSRCTGNSGWYNSHPKYYTRTVE